MKKQERENITSSDSANNAASRQDESAHDNDGSPMDVDEAEFMQNSTSNSVQAIFSNALPEEIEKAEKALDTVNKKIIQRNEQEGYKDSEVNIRTISISTYFGFRNLWISVLKKAQEQKDMTYGWKEYAHLHKTIMAYNTLNSLPLSWNLDPLWPEEELGKLTSAPDSASDTHSDNDKELPDDLQSLKSRS
ncbi:hypothetical protein PRK78_000493 [Emydomyces testavorans]|uniref:Uncharacterized protein n=1 Tax=Emydomyces testavorans TaxID=2070801 RepID=A0AAF0DB92_9EURO|nr:hypothetical protein PRK78_000493 [Emydomyces testavorans]